MRSIFADSFYWIAMVNPQDAWHKEARRLTAELVGVQLVTTEETLIEFLNWFSRGGYPSRQKGVQLVHALMNRPDVQVVPQTHEGFVAALQLYERRLDKEYSMTDCLSMETLRSMGITEVLTHDKHFQQEGFQLLFGKAP